MDQAQNCPFICQFPSCSMKFSCYKDLSRHVGDHCPTCGQDTRPILLQYRKPDTTKPVQSKQPDKATQPKLSKQHTQLKRSKTTPWLYRDVDKLRSLHCYNTGTFLTYEEWKAFTGQDTTDASSSDDDDERHFSC
jgi:hypothetical protein